MLRGWDVQDVKKRNIFENRDLPVNTVHLPTKISNHVTGKYLKRIIYWGSNHATDFNK